MKLTFKCIRCHHRFSRWWQPRSPVLTVICPACNRARVIWASDIPKVFEMVLRSTEGTK